MASLALCARHSSLFLELLALLTTVLGPHQERRWVWGEEVTFQASQQEESKPGLEP